LRRRLWDMRTDDRPPYVFEGYATQHLPGALATGLRPTAYLGRVIDVPLSLAAFPLDSTPGRHLAVLGPSETGATCSTPRPAHSPRSTTRGPSTLYSHHSSPPSSR